MKATLEVWYEEMPVLRLRGVLVNISEIDKEERDELTVSNVASGRYVMSLW